MLKIMMNLGVVSFLLSGCAGMKVVHPEDANKDQGTKMVDWSGGSPKIVSTFTCKLESTGNHFSAIGKTEKEARVEVLARCRDHAVVSFCKEDKIVCVNN